MHYLQHFHETDDFESEDSCKLLFINVPHYQRKLQFLRCFQKTNAEKTQHKNEHLASTKRSFQEILKECLKNDLNSPHQKRGETHFYKKRQEKESAFTKYCCLLIRTAVRTKRKKKRKNTKRAPACK